MNHNTCPYCNNQCTTLTKKLRLASNEFNIFSKKNSTTTTCTSCKKPLEVKSGYHLLPFLALVIILLFSKTSSFTVIGTMITLAWLLTFGIFYFSPFKKVGKK